MNDYIRMIQERELVSFEEAQYYLRKAGGNVEQAIFLIQKRKRSFWYRLSENTKGTFQSFWRYRVMIGREDRMFLNISFSMFLLILWVLWLINFTGVQVLWLLILLMVFVIASGSEFRLVKTDLDGAELLYNEKQSKEQNYPKETPKTVQWVDKDEGNAAQQKNPLAESSAETTINTEQKQEPTTQGNAMDEYSEIIIK